MESRPHQQAPLTSFLVGFGRGRSFASQAWPCPLPILVVYLCFSSLCLSFSSFCLSSESFSSKSLSAWLSLASLLFLLSQEREAGRLPPQFRRSLLYSRE